MGEQKKSNKVDADSKPEQAKPEPAIVEEVPVVMEEPKLVMIDTTGKGEAKVIDQPEEIKEE